MARVMTGIHKGGRPAKYSDEFYLSILKEFENHTYSQIAKNHNVTKGSVTNWMKRAREIANERQEEPV